MNFLFISFNQEFFTTMRDILKVNWSSFKKTRRRQNYHQFTIIATRAAKSLRKEERMKHEMCLHNYSSYELNESVNEWMGIAWVRV